MKRRSLLKVALFSAVLLFALSAAAQTTLPAPSPSPTPTPIKVDVVYTGRLLGYFRVPSLQEFTATSGCPDVSSEEYSEAAKKFFAARTPQATRNTVLVGTGDNFSPQLEARVFDGPPPNGPKYAVGNKELYLGADHSWVPYNNHSPTTDVLRNKIAAGLGTIPNDNVACFLRRAKYAAIVPGKHDFYFGAERVREFARFLAANGSGDYDPVQMLGANLVLATGPIKPTPDSEKVKADRNFELWPTEYPVQNLTDGKSVYPWFSVVKIQLADIPEESFFLPALRKLQKIASQDLRKFITDNSKTADGNLNNLKGQVANLESQIKQADDRQRTDLLEEKKSLEAKVAQLEADKKRLADLDTNLDSTIGPAAGNTTVDAIRICTSTDRPNDLPDDLKDCKPTEHPTLRVEGSKVMLDVQLPPKFYGKNGHFTTLMFGKNFGLCTFADKSKKSTEKKCLRFSTHTPFFYFPHEVAYENGDGYSDPDPYVVLNDEVAIFGVVEPTLGDQVGILNFGWRHKDQPELTARLSVEDPVDALQQQLDNFSVRKPNFSGMKVLLAQMTPQRARALAARFPDFQIVLSAADLEQATSAVTLSSTWTKNPAAGSFLAVPAPYFNRDTREGAVQLGVVKAESDAEKTKWTLSGVAQQRKPVEEKTDPAPKFWARIKELPGCVPSGFQRDPTKNYDNLTYLKWLVLCTMQQQLSADVAFIQEQDLYEKLPLLDKELKLLNRATAGKDDAERDENLQQMLDRLIWKGDLLTLIYVPGKALKKALDQSGKFADEEKETLVLSVDRGRKLETLGVRTDKGEYFINELPLDEDRIYAVATTDYIATGHTGYADLAAAARDPRTHPAAFTGDLITISSLVCRKLFLNDPAKVDQHCLDPVTAIDYLDETTARQTPPYPAEGSFSRFWATTSIAWPGKREELKDPAAVVEQRVQRRSFWGFSLKNVSIGFKDVDNNRTDDSLNEKFAGVPTAGVSSTANRTISFNLDSRLSYFADRHELFLGTGIDYERQSQGDPRLATGISLNKNRVFGDIGSVWWRRPGREFPNLGLVLSIHGETQLEAPFSAFNLNTPAEEQVRITQQRGLLALGRVGARWQNRANTFEFGAQAGREFRALRGYHFENAGGVDAECLVNSAQTLSACIAEKSKPPDGLITGSSVPTALLQGRPRVGIYWSHTLSFPLGSRMKYEVTQDADFFFVKFHRDTSIDTRFRYNSKNRLSFMIWPNFSIGPTLDLFMYQNKVNRNFLFQRTLGIETKLSFDIFNRREKAAQVISRE